MNAAAARAKGAAVRPSAARSERASRSVSPTVPVRPGPFSVPARPGAPSARLPALPERPGALSGRPHLLPARPGALSGRPDTPTGRPDAVAGAVTRRGASVGPDALPVAALRESSVRPDRLAVATRQVPSVGRDAPARGARQGARLTTPRPETRSSDGNASVIVNEYGEGETKDRRFPRTRRFPIRNPRGGRSVFRSSRSAGGAQQHAKLSHHERTAPSNTPSSRTMSERRPATRQALAP